MKHWYLLKTKPRQEKVAVSNLENQGYHAYCPESEINKKIVVLFPGYLFIYLDDETQNWSPIRSTKGVISLVRFGLHFARIPKSVIELIKINELNTIEKIKNLSKFKKGDKVQITDGVFKNCIAIFESLKEQDRVHILMNLLGRQQNINLSQNALTRL
tara:strand:+ start:85 stop:558 length:474 start_codon:yes stop_codon:yes gene_type:complete